MYRAPLIEPDFQVPTSLEARQFRLRPLDFEVMLQDYAAVLEGASNIAAAYERDASYYRNFTLQDEVIELGWHIGEWRRRKSFAYAIMSHDGARCYGSFYLYPTFKRGYEAMGVLWMVPGTPAAADPQTFATISRWVSEAWPFANVGYPGREPSWAAWHALPEQRGD